MKDSIKQVYSQYAGWSAIDTETIDKHKVLEVFYEDITIPYSSLEKKPATNWGGLYYKNVENFEFSSDISFDFFSVKKIKCWTGKYFCNLEYRFYFS